MSDAERAFPAGYEYVQVASGNWRRPCYKCGGSGEYQGHTPYYRAGGFRYCFECNGSGYGGKFFATREAAVKHAESLAKGKEKRAAARAEQDAKFAAKRAEWAAEKAAKRAERAVGSEYLDAPVGAKVQVSGEVVFVKDVSSQYGQSRLVIFKVSESVKVKFFSSAEFVWSLEAGQRFDLAATVKKHEEYQGEKSTQVVRPQRVSDVILPAAA